MDVRFRYLAIVSSIRYPSIIVFEIGMDVRFMTFDPKYLNLTSIPISNTIIDGYLIEETIATDI